MDGNPLLKKSKKKEKHAIFRVKKKMPKFDTLTRFLSLSAHKHQKKRVARSRVKEGISI
jgi:hypothetical protein